MENGRKAMARMLSKSLFLRGSILHHHHHHHQSSFRRCFSSKPELFEIDLDSPSPASTIKKMEEIIHSIIIQKSTPDWLPFLPGSSFWVPLPSHGSKRVSDFIEIFTNQLTPDEHLSLTTGRGWPCLPFLIQDGEHPEQEEEGVNVVLLVGSEDK